MSPLREMFFNRQPVTEAKKEEIVRPQLKTIEARQIPDANFDQIKKEIDWDVFWKIIDEIAVRSGIDPKQLNKLSVNDILNIGIPVQDPNSTHTPSGIYFVTSNKIGINMSKIEEAAKKFGVDPKLMAIETICHELVHAISRQEVHYFQDFDYSTLSFKDITMAKGAFRSSKSETTRNTKGKVTSSRDIGFYDMLDEGITETLANEIFEEYIKRTGSAEKKEIKDYATNFFENENRQYPILVKCVRLLCEKISKRAGVEKGIVWKSFVRGIFHFDTLNHQEAKLWFTQNFPGDFLDQISKAKNPNELLAVLQKD